jgi:light-regulated signal transduction histidine kinase (bacteriophytochrome)
MQPILPNKPDSEPNVAALALEVTRLRQELARTQAALGDFAYTVSHDLRARVRHVQAYTQIAVEDLGSALTPEADKHLQVVLEAATHMGLQIDGLLKWVALDRMELNQTPLCLSQLIDEVRQSLAPQLAQRQLQWNLPSNPPQLHADPQLVRELMLCVLSNAIKFTRTRPVAEVHIQCEPVQTAALCVVTVRDNGVGFKAALKDKLFQVFQRLHPSHEYEGVGMGLALAKKIVERHGGSIWAEGAPDAGCSVRFSLPVWGRRAAISQTG